MAKENNYKIVYSIQWIEKDRARERQLKYNDNFVLIFISLVTRLPQRKFSNARFAFQKNFTRFATQTIFSFANALIFAIFSFARWHSMENGKIVLKYLLGRWIQRVSILRSLPFIQLLRSNALFDGSKVKTAEKEWKKCGKINVY